MKTRSLFFFIIASFHYVLPPQGALAADAPLRQVRMAFTSLSGSMSPPWYAHMGGIFKKNGLEVEVIATPSGVEGMNALIAGEVQFVQISGGTTTSAALGGADVMIIGTTVDTLIQNLMARPEIEKGEQLRGKSLGITRFGTSIDTGARIALRHFGLVAEKDVAIVQIGGMESIVPAMHANRVQAGILSYPSITQAKKRKPTRRNSSTIPSYASYSRAALSMDCTDKPLAACRPAAPTLPAVESSEQSLL